MIFFTGANLPPIKIADRTVVDKLLNAAVNLNQGGTSISYNCIYGSSASVESGLKEIEDIRKAYPNGRIIIYGYSYGGVLANKLAKQLEEKNISVDLLVTVDAANGPWSSSVDRKIGKNVKKNINYYEKNKAEKGYQKIIGSNGDANTGSKEGQVENHDLSNEKYGDKNVNHYNIDAKTLQDVINALIDAFKNTSRENEIRKLTKDEIKAFFNKN